MIIQYLIGTLKNIENRVQFEGSWLFDDDRIGEVEIHSADILEQFVGQRMELQIYSEAKMLAGPVLRTRRFHVAAENLEYESTQKRLS